MGKGKIWKVSDSVSLDDNCPSSEMRGKVVNSHWAGLVRLGEQWKGSRVKQKKSSKETKLELLLSYSALS